MKNRVLTGMIVLFCANLTAQEKLGITMSNYSPVNSLFLNPTSTSDSKTYLQMKLLGFHAFASTNVAYLPAFSLPSFISGFSFPSPEFYNDDRNRNGFFTLALEGPCFTVSRDNFGAGLYVRGRSNVNLRRIPSDLMNVLVGDGSSDHFQTHFQNAGFNNLTWVEIGGNFSYILLKKGDNMVQGGVNLNYLLGVNVVHGNISLLEGSYSGGDFDLGIVRASVVQGEPAFFAGKGFAGDLGFVYKKMLHNIDNYLPHSRRSNCRNIPYKYKIGGSLRDLGYIKFGSVTTTSISGAGYINVDTDQGIPGLPSVEVDQTESEGSARALMPMSASVQFDYNFENRIYVGAVLVKNIAPGKAVGVMSPDLLAIVPRYETKNFEVAMPFTLQRFTYPHIGLAFRIRSFVLGVDNVIPLFMASDVNTLGLYVNLGISQFRSRKCGSNLRGVDECMPRPKRPAQKKAGLIRRIFDRNKTYRK